MGLACSLIDPTAVGRNSGESCGIASFASDGNSVRGKTDLDAAGSVDEGATAVSLHETKIYRKKHCKGNKKDRKGNTYAAGAFALRAVEADYGIVNGDSETEFGLALLVGQNSGNDVSQSRCQI